MISIITPVAKEYRRTVIALTASFAFLANRGNGECQSTRSTPRTPGLLTSPFRLLPFFGLERGGVGRRRLIFDPETTGAGSEKNTSVSDTSTQATRRDAHLV